MKNRTKIVLIIAALLLITAAAGFTLASFTTEQTATNKISASNVKVELILEEDTDGTLSAASEALEVVPGKDISRIAKGKNVGKEPFYVRAKVGMNATGADNAQIQIKDGDIVLAGLNTSDWTYKDGYYYYNKALNSNETTEALFTQVSFAKTMDNTYAGAQVKLEVEFQATQAANNGASATEAAGWPE